MEAVEAAERGIEVPQPGQYDVWVWSKGGGPGKVTLAEQTLEIAAGDVYRWSKAGTLELKAGKIKLAPDSAVAAIALSQNPAFDPAKAMTDMRVSDQPAPVHDRRLDVTRCTRTAFTMPEFESREAWETFAAALRRRILLSSGLWPLPERAPLNTKVFDSVTRDDYIVEKVHFEARPGFLVTGNLYRPKGNGPFPAVANPHGHWGRGRFEDTEAASIPGRCITFARMGMVAFSYDMVGYNDSRQFPHEWGGKPEKLWGIHPFGAQLWSSMRAIDFLQSLPYVDPERIGCTGASGGGTQTFALFAVDDRVKAAAPAVMVSRNMQGGCPCENAPLLRLTNSNMEIAGLMAPRPLLLISATGDWTWEVPRIEFPAILNIYKLYGAEDRIENFHQVAAHNYNRAAREAVYRFFGKWLLGDAQRWAGFAEPPFSVEPEGALRVFPDNERPAGYPNQEEIISATIDSCRAKWRAVLPKKNRDIARFRQEYGVAINDVLGVSIPRPNDLSAHRVSVDKREKHVFERWVLSRLSVGDTIPALLYRDQKAAPQDAALIVHGAGKAALANLAQGGPGELIQGLLEAGKAVMSIDVFLTGEHHSPQERTKRPEITFQDTFMPTDTAYRVQDVITALAYLRSRPDITGSVDVVGLEGAGIWCLFAAALDTQVRRTLVDANQFPSQDDAAWAEKYYVPAIRSIGDVATAGFLIAPRALWTTNTGAAFDTTGIRKAYETAQSDAFRTSSKAASVRDAVMWLK
jgi:dienelactone hydrolase